MTLFEQLKAGGRFDPSPELIRSCEAALVIQAHLATVRPIVDGYQKAILAAGVYRMCEEMRQAITNAGHDPGEARITDPERSYMLADDDAKRYFAACEKAAKEAGLRVKREENCPLLEAQHLLVDAENTLLAIFASDMGEPILACPIKMEHRARLLEVIFGMVAPHMRDAEQLLRRFAA